MVKLAAEKFNASIREENLNKIKLTVQESKGAITVLCWGSEPFAYDVKNGKYSLIPNGFKVETICDGRLWTGDILVDEEVFLEDDEFKSKQTIYYRFCIDDKSGGWQPTPTTAYSKALNEIGQPLKQGTNGRVIIGVTYPNIQEEIAKRFPEEYEQMLRKIKN